MLVSVAPVALADLFRLRTDARAAVTDVGRHRHLVCTPLHRCQHDRRVTFLCFAFFCPLPVPEETTDVCVQLVPWFHHTRGGALPHHRPAPGHLPCAFLVAAWLLRPVVCRS